MCSFVQGIFWLSSKMIWIQILIVTLLLVVTYWDCDCFENSTPWSRYWDLDTDKQKDPPEVLCFVLWQIHLGTTILCQVSHIKNSEGIIVVFFLYFFIFQIKAILCWYLDFSTPVTLIFFWGFTFQQRWLKDFQYD